MSNTYKPLNLKPSIKDPPKSLCCLHRNLVPLEYGFARVTYPNGYAAEPYYNFAITSIDATVMRVRTYLCLDCKQEIKAPEPGVLKKDRL